VPALSRITAYIETVRINKVGAMDALSAATDLSNSRSSEYENGEVMMFLSDLSSPGLLIIKGPSGTGKTSAIKKWILEAKANSYAYFDQGGFSPNSNLEELLELLGATDVVNFNQVSFLKDRVNTKLVDLSGGQARFVQLYVLLSKQVDRVVLDEPSVGLDASLRTKLETLILDKSKSSLVVVISHDAEFISSLCKSGGRLFEV